MTEWTDRYWTSSDGLRLHYRDHDGPADRPPIICLPGLTRNARDFEPVADRFAGEWRVLSVDFRGRGLSEFDPKPERYLPFVYAADVIELLDQIGIERVVLLGTSRGGIVTMMLAAHIHDRIAAAMLNDVGPEVDPGGIERIKSYVGQPSDSASWDELSGALAATNADVYPDFDKDQWLRFARRLSIERDGRPELDYDMRIADNFQQTPVQTPDQPAASAWPLYEKLKGIPLLILRGELSDLLTPDVARKMAEALPDAELVTVPRVGHPPTLDEPESLAAIERLLARALSVSRPKSA